MSDKTADEFLELAKGLRALSVALGDFRFAHWKILKEPERNELKALEVALLDRAGEVCDSGVLARLQLEDSQLDVLRKCTAGLKQAAQHVADVKQEIGQLTKFVTIGGALFVAVSSADPVAIVAAAMQLLDLVTGGSKAQTT
jgi:hypothetical protein